MRLHDRNLTCATLGLTGYTIVVEPAVPSDAAAKADPVVKAALRTMDAKLRKDEWLSAATTSCYAELVGGDLLYARKQVGGTNLFAKWTFRDFGRDGAAQLRSFPEKVKNPLAIFPPRRPIRPRRQGPICATPMPRGSWNMSRRRCGVRRR